MRLSDSNKRSHLWNVQEPGDPYDIRKSMIARLPNHPPKPMGEHLELICLLQAAQIQRLSQYLSEIQCKYRQVEKKQLDRHSYEIQIKQLAEKNISFVNLKAENDRLKDFIRRQTIELQQLQKKNIQSMNMQALNGKYQNVLNELGVARQQSQRSEATISRLNYELTQWKHKFERVQLEKINLKSQFDLQINQRISIQIRKTLNQAEERNSRIQHELKQVRQNSDNKNHELQLLLSQKDQLLRQLKQMEDKIRNQNNFQMTLSEKNRQIQRLNSIIEDKNIKLEQAQASTHRLGGQLKVIEEKYFNLQKQRQSLMVRVREAELSESRRSDLDKYEQRVAMMSMQIQRLNNIGASRNRHQQETRSELDRIRYQLSQVKAERDQLKRNQADFAKIASHQQKISLLSQQLQRVTFQLHEKKQQIRQLQYKFSASQANSSQLTLIATEKGKLEQQLHASRTELRNYKSITDKQLNNLKSECQKLRQQLAHHNVHKSYVEKYQLQCERLRVELQRVRNQSISHRRTYEQQRLDIQRLTVQLNRSAEQRKYLAKENSRIVEQVNLLRRDLENYKLMNHDMDLKDKTILDLQNNIQIKDSRIAQISSKIASVYNEIQRLHSILSSKTNQMVMMKKDHNQLEERYHKLENILKGTSSQKQSNHKQVQRLNYELQTINKLKSQLTAQIQIQAKQIIFIKQKQEQTISHKDKIINQYIKQKQGLERKLVDLQKDLAQRVPFQEQVAKDYQKSIQQSRNKDIIIQQLQVTIKQIKNNLIVQNNKYQQLEHITREKQMKFRDIEGIFIIKQQEIQKLNKQIYILKDKIKQYEIRRSQEEKLNDKIHVLTQDNLKLKMKLDEIERNRNSSEDDVKLQLKRAEETITFERSQSQSLRHHIHRMTQQIQLQRQKIKEYQLKIVHIQNTNSKVLQEKMKEKEGQNQQQKYLIASLQQEIKSLQTQFSRYVDKDRSTITNLTQYENKIALLSTEFQRLNQLVVQKNKQNREKQQNIMRLTEQINQLKINNKDSRNNKDQDFIIHLKNQIDQLTRNIQDQDRVIQQLRTKGYRNNPLNHSQCEIEITNLKTALEQLENINIHTIAQRDQLFKVSHQIKSQYDEQIARFIQQERQLRKQLQHRIDENRSRGEELGLLRKKQQTYLIQISQLQTKRKQEDPNLRRLLTQSQQKSNLYKQQNQELRIQNKNLHTQISQIELMFQKQRVNSDKFEQINLLRRKIQQNAQLLAAKDQDLMEWENKYTSLYTAYEQLYANYNLTKSQYEITIKNVKVYQSKLFQLEEDFSALSEALRNTKRQLERYENQNYQLQNKLQGDGDLFQKNILLSQQIDRLNIKAVQMQQDLTQTRIRLTDGISLNKRIEENLGLFVVLFAEIESLRNRLVHSEKECEEVRRSSLVPLRVDKNMGPKP